MKSRRILHLMSGSIACAKATGLTSAWVKAGHEVRVAATHSVAQFVGNATLEGFSGHPVLSDAFAGGRVMDHVNLARWADLIVAAPATANLINKLAAGIADDAVTSLWQAAWERGYPMIIVPAMNTRMWRYPATQASVERLTSWGGHVLPTADGDLACGEMGAGRMLEVDDILARVEALTAPRSGAKILITGGGTREPIDSVRYIGNTSTGRTASALADRLANHGHDVTWLGAAQAEQPRRVARRVHYSSFADLRDALQRLLSEESFDAVIHAAAVSDYSVAGLSGTAGSGSGKLPSGQELELRLQPNPKLIDALKGWSRNPSLRIAGFKLTDTSDTDKHRQSVSELFQRAKTDLVVHNDLGDIRAGTHPFTVYRAPDRPDRLGDVAALADWLNYWLNDLAEDAP
ncbi:bifunctional phosphopantothenoylcysteine decarboxylase/phosphopantothenate--cysteine ligase CoaBC [Elongatibacter sediminis]|uniref:Coenzyme A biosynthesis bifunctional protein CoaBC n=1 Tax=Elongatibacter sediminis TaxID=3119006 RepID=A0AAW9RGE0_9GAMM